jgi:Bacterial regulatory proteins, tetR family/Tetracyclin repressor-like, C-terminal domain
VTEPKQRRSGRVRMTSAERREQLIAISRGLFAQKGYEATSVEEIAARAEVSKPVVYEHFGGKEGLYAVVLDYIESSSDGFRILVRDSPVGSSTGSFISILSDVATRVEYILAEEFKRRGLDPKNAPMYAQMLVGMVALTGQWWLDVRKPRKQDVAAHLVNLAWNGLSRLEAKPTLSTRPHK